MYGGIKKKTITCHYCPLPFSLTKHLKPPLPKSCFLILIQFQVLGKFLGCLEGDSEKEEEEEGRKRKRLRKISYFCLFSLLFKLRGKKGAVAC
ncbi:hypothetical protein ERO13_A08G120050v2 [Gossypium hirsutum]|nr:hypothetical protein ERO13_A08G120050v2 [Gossypium hirsutum]